MRSQRVCRQQGEIGSSGAGKKVTGKSPLYKVTFALAGFSTLVRDGIELPANFTASVNVDMKVGALEETVTVSGSSPLVDVQSSQQTVNLRREVLDALPTARTYAAEGSLA